MYMMRLRGEIKESTYRKLKEIASEERFSSLDELMEYLILLHRKRKESLRSGTVPKEIKEKAKTVMKLVALKKMLEEHLNQNPDDFEAKAKLEEVKTQLISMRIISQDQQNKNTTEHKSIKDIIKELKEKI